MVKATNSTPCVCKSLWSVCSVPADGVLFFIRCDLKANSIHMQWLGCRGWYHLWAYLARSWSPHHLHSGMQSLCAQGIWKSGGKHREIQSQESRRKTRVKLPLQFLQYQVQVLGLLRIFLGFSSRIWIWIHTLDPNEPEYIIYVIFSTAESSHEIASRIICSCNM